MIEEVSFNLIHKYINGWKKNDLPMILSCLSENCIIIESHGPVYNGISNVEDWFNFWLEAKSTIEKWDILSIYFCKKEKTAFVEWDFSCISNGAQYSLPGISVIKFDEQKISFIHEYRMTHQAYTWEGKKLNSE